MASNYETQRKMRAAQVGTIMPWVGDNASKPDGWLECNGQTIEATDYPILASVIGNTYGPSNGLNNRTYPNYLLGDQFRLPALNGRVLTDYESSLVNVTNLQMGQTYPSGAVGGLIILEGETDITRTSQTVNITSNTTQLVLGTGVTGVALQLTVDCDINGRVAVSNIVNKGSGFATGNKLTIPAAVFNGSDDIVIQVAWVLPSVADVLTPTGAGTTQLIDGDGSTVSPPTALNATADLNFVVTDSQNMTAQIRNFSVNPPVYFKSYYTVPRKLSKDHMPSHRHAGPDGTAGGYSRADADAGFVEGFQCPGIVGAVESNQKQKRLDVGAGGDIDTVDPGVLLVTYYQEGVTTVTNFQPVKNNVASVGTQIPMPCWTGPIPRALNGTYPNECNYRESSQSGFMTNKKNWYGSQTADQINQSTGVSQTYPTTLNHLKEDMVGNSTINSHNHYSFEVVMNAGYVRPPTIVPVDTIQVQSNLTGSPTNIGVQNIPSALNINVDIKTPALSMMYLIRAY